MKGCTVTGGQAVPVKHCDWGSQLENLRIVGDVKGSKMFNQKLDSKESLKKFLSNCFYLHGSRLKSRLQRCFVVFFLFGILQDLLFNLVM